LVKSIDLKHWSIKNESVKVGEKLYFTWNFTN
jgi:hypothetical protein